ncbi:BatD family protein [Candidatus Sumerlaeota bacterium]|nr:BatD family protein [Candidatus Sumerlaeota bacterium]
MTLFRALRNALTILLTGVCATLLAQTTTPRPLPPGMSVTASVSNEKPVVGDQFQYTIEVLGSVGVDSWKDPDLTKLKGMRVRSGAEISSSMKITNGRSTMSANRSILLEATQVGSFVIPPGQVKISGITYDTNPVTVTVSDVPKLGGDLDSIISARTNSTEINRQLQGKYFARAEMPEKIYRGQAVPVNIYIYRSEKLPSLSQWQILPDQNDGDDFVRPNVRDPRMQAQRIDWESVTFGGQNFQRVLLYTMYIVPTKTGKLRFTPPTLQVELPVEQRSASRDPIADMMMNFQRTVSATLAMRSVDVDVAPVPDKPAEALMQLVGRARVDLKTDRQELPQRELLTVKLSIVGNGFFDLVSQPKAPDLAGFSLIDTKSSSRMDITKGLLFSEKNFEYVYQAAEAGERTIPSIAVAVFNPAEGASDSQNILRTEPVKVLVTASTAAAVQIGGVAAGANTTAQGGTAAPKAGAKVLGSDVSYIDVRPLTLAGASAMPPFYLQPWFWFAQFVPFLGALGYGLAAVARRNRREESDAERARKGRRAATLALKETRAKLDSGSRDEFYATLANGVLQYVASLLGRSRLGLTSEEAVQKLSERGFPADVLARLQSLLNMCDTIRYSPAADTPDARRAAMADAETLLTDLTSGKKS